MTPFAETRGARNHSDLREATGCWSGHNVLFNPGSETVILDRSVAMASGAEGAAVHPVSPTCVVIAQP